MPDIDLASPRYFINRELSWLEFNARVLEEALDRSNPVLERLKFLSIFSSNLDEFFMIRVANLRELEEARVTDTRPDGMAPREQLDAIAARTHELVRDQVRCLRDEVLPSLASHGLRLLRIDQLDATQRDWLANIFRKEIFPVLTPMTVDPSHPFPHLPNQSLNLLVALGGPVTTENGDTNWAVVEVPPMLDALVEIRTDDTASHTFVPLADLIAHHAAELFYGLPVNGAWAFRVTRNADLTLAEQEVENLLQDLERELRNRATRRVVRIEADARMPAEFVEKLASGMHVARREVYLVDSFLHVPDLMRLYGIDAFRHLKDPPFNPRLSPRLATNESIFSVIREKDLLLHHPYESFSTVAELLQYAAHDPKVLAIKLTLYRTSGDSVIIQALKDAAERGKQVTAVVELKARFDEKNNIVWARELERAGAHVIYGIVGLKTHAKAALIVRRESGHIKRYVHLSTGNYNSTTARLYTDIGLMTCDPDIGEDVSTLFNVLTGYNTQIIQEMIAGRHAGPSFRKISVAPFFLRQRILELIDREIELHRPDAPGLIQAKLNALADPTIIRALYRASQAGVKVNLAVRGICCLRPGVPGVSDNITVTSVVDRFLEHSRVLHLRHGGQNLVFVGSADFMQRNFYRRIETMFPIEDPDVKERVIGEILQTCLADNVKARRLMPDGGYSRVVPAPGEPPIRSQEQFIARARKGGIKSLPYDEAIRSLRKGGKKKKARKSANP